MAKVYNVNMDPVYGGSSFFYTFKETLKSAGWVVSQSSDGSTFFSASDGITTDGPGAGGMDNNLAWYWILDPDLKKGMVVQRGAQEYSWRLHIAANFQNDTTVEGNATSITKPSDTTFHSNPSGWHQSIGTFNGNFETFFDTSGSYRYHIVAQDTPYNGTYAFHCFCSTYPTLTGKTNTYLYWEPFMSGAHHPNNLAPWMFRANYIWGSSFTTYGFNTFYPSYYQTPYLLFNKVFNSSIGVSGSTLVMQAYGGSNYFHSASHQNYITVASQTNNTSVVITVIANGFIDPQDSKDFLTPIPIYSSTNSRFFSYTSYIKTNHAGTHGASAGGRKYPDTTNITTDAYVIVGAGGYSFPWPENVVPIA